MNARMMEEQIKDIFAGRHVPVDLILNHRSEEGFKTPPVTKRNVCYIVSTVLFDEAGRVLLVQEAKKSCRGQWYLPAGRLEPGETIVNGAKREVNEEAGLDCDLTTLLCVEINGIWMRFTFTGIITGGSLKTLEEKDEESLQAKFFHPDELPKDIRPTKWLNQDPNTSSSKGGSGSCVLRCNDILKLITLGRKFAKEKNHKDCLPVVYPHKYITHRFVIIDRPSTSSMQVLASKKGDNLCIPTVLENVKRTVPLLAAIASILNSAFSKSPSECSFQVCGVLGIEHRGTGDEEDGMCITHLVNMALAPEQALPEITASAQFSWHSLECTDLKTQLLEGCQRKIVPIL